MPLFCPDEQVLIVIKADTNDADYIHNIIERKIDVSRLKRIWEVVKNNDGSWPWSEYCDETAYEVYADRLSEDDIVWFENVLPYGEHGIHTVESIEIYYYTDKVSL